MKSFNADTTNENLSPLSLGDLWSTLYRRKHVIMASMAVFLALGLVFSEFAPKKYSAEAVILLESQEKNVEIKSVLAEIPNDPSLVPSEIQVLISRNLMGRVLDDLDMVSQPDQIYGTGKKQEATDPAVAQMDDEAKKEIRENLIDVSLANLDVKQVEKSRAISVSYIARDPVVAAKVVNKLTTLYIEQQISNNFEAVRLTNGWLSERVVELQKKVKESESKVAEYRKKTGLVNSRGNDLVEQDVSDLSSKLIDARAKLADTSARLSEIGNADKLESAPSVLSSPLIQKLRENEANARNDLASLSDKLGPGHPQITEAKAKVDEIQAKIQQEINKIAEGLRRENQVARNSVRLIEAEIKKVKVNYNSDKSDNIDLAALEREAETNRKFLETINLRWKETQTQEDSRFQVPYARIISTASVPTSPVSPKVKLVLAAAVLAGFGLGSALALALDQVQNTVYNGKQIQEITGLNNISLIAAAMPGRLKKLINFADMPIKDPSSSYMDGVREVSAYLKLEKSKNPAAKVFNFTSAAGGEGKTSLVASLARQLALEGVRVVAVDCDIRNAVLSNMYGMSDKKGLAEILANKLEVRDAIQGDSLTSLAIIPSGKSDKNVIIQSPESWQKLVDQLSQDFDIILLDSPPILSAPESKITAKISSNIFCIRWKKTPLNVVGFALDTMQRTDAHMTGTIVTMAEGKIASRKAA